MDTFRMGTLAFYDGLRSYNILKSIAKCNIKDLSTITEDEKTFYHPNTANNFTASLKDDMIFVVALQPNI